MCKVAYMVHVYVASELITKSHPKNIYSLLFEFDCCNISPTYEPSSMTSSSFKS
jgi:hypothetical protein